MIRNENIKYGSEDFKRLSQNQIITAAGQDDIVHVLLGHNTF
jgi:hypothetical protein